MGVVTNEINIKKLQVGIEALPTIMTSVANCVEAVAYVQTSVRNMDLAVSGLQTRVNTVENEIAPQPMLNGLFTDSGFSDNYELSSNSIAYKVGKIAVLCFTLKKKNKWTHEQIVDLHLRSEMAPASPNQVVDFGRVTDNALIDSTSGDDCYVFINNNGVIRFNPYGSTDHDYVHFSACYVTL